MTACFHPGVGWYGSWTVGSRVAWALISVGVVVAGLWWISATTTLKYESRTSSSSDRPSPKMAANPGRVLEGSGAGRPRAGLHSAAALSAAALIVMLPAGHSGLARWLVLVVAVAVLWRRPSRCPDGRTPPGDAGLRWQAAGRSADLANAVLAAAVPTLVFAALVSARTDQRLGPTGRAAPPGRLSGRAPGGAGRTPRGVDGHRGRAGRRARAAGCYREVPPFLGGWPCLAGGVDGGCPGRDSGRAEVN